jgi:uncharacterized protein (DUF697 family)
MLGKIWDQVTSLFSPRVDEQEIRKHLDDLRHKTPIPVFWLLGRTQSGKTSLVRYLTGAERAEIGRGYQSCTRYSSKYQFPNEQAPLLTFLDTRGLDEPGYDASEDIARFNEEAHVVLVTVKLLDHAVEKLIEQLRRVRAARRERPVLLVLTCLHEAYPQQQHPQPYPFGPDAVPLPEAQLPAEVLDSLAFQRQRFAGLVDGHVAVDLTLPEEGFAEPNYGGEALRQALLDLLPQAQATTLRTLALAQKDLQDLFARKAVPTILAYSTMAGTAGAVPVPVLDLVLISAIQTRMVYDLAALYGTPLTTQRLAELTGALGLGLLGRQAGRSLIKVIPGLGSVAGSVAGGALAAASTYALGQAFCYYYRVVLQGHVPDTADLKRYYDEQLKKASDAWQKLHPSSKQEPSA